MVLIIEFLLHFKWEMAVSKFALSANCMEWG